ncbi:hypothetical protein KJ742_06345 [Patescibacteria group bacterium]|nr:hypothetical protein [Patescibacteria group bacterium]MBU1683531.1 hypothetical protein [Patescibacteria group bacterium]MBU1935017.1 hypothetical protein [Patescibacteria group bacterium]
MKSLKISAQVLTLRKTKLLVFGVLLAISIILPAFIHVQWITGPIINASLLLATVLVGPMEAMLLGLMPSAVALSTGLLPFALAPMVPFIMIANAILIAVFYYSDGQNYFLRIGIAALLKFAFLHFSVVLVMSTMLEGTILSKLAVMMSWPQFITAVIGGIIIYPIIKSYAR